MAQILGCDSNYRFGCKSNSVANSDDFSVYVSYIVTRYLLKPFGCTCNLIYVQCFALCLADSKLSMNRRECKIGRKSFLMLHKYMIVGC